MYISLQTSRLNIREIDINLDDLSTYLEWLRDTENNQFIQSARQDYNMEELVNFIKTTNSNENALLYGLFLKENNNFIGTLKVEPINYLEGTAWIGIMIGSTQFRGLGFGKEAISGVLEYLFNVLNLRETYLGVDLGNLSAIALYKSLGFTEYTISETRMIMSKINIT